MTKEQIILISENIRRFSLTMPDNTIEDREEFWSMCEKAINTIAKNNEVLDLVSCCTLTRSSESTAITSCGKEYAPLEEAKYCPFCGNEIRNMSNNPRKSFLPK